jgi:hypothetical protein
LKDDNQPAESGEAEAFLERWSRRKVEARAGNAEAEEAPALERADADPPGEAAAPPPLPDLDSLDESSDYSAFLAPDVDDVLRRQALRKLFHSPKFNVCDGLDDYCEDFTTFDKLGDIVTADMRHQLERAARRLEQMAESGEQGSSGSDNADVSAQEPESPDERHPDDDRPEPA